MKKILLVLTTVLLVISCSKDEISTDDLKTLKGTEWMGQIYDYEYNESFTSTLTFISESKVTVTSGGDSETGSYTYNSKLKTGTISDGQHQAPFEIKGNDLVLEVEKDVTASFKRIK